MFVKRYLILLTSQLLSVKLGFGRWLQHNCRLRSCGCPDKAGDKLRRVKLKKFAGLIPEITSKVIGQRAFSLTEYSVRFRANSAMSSEKMWV